MGRPMTDVDTHMTQYLLGALSEDEREAFEREYFSNAGAFDRLVDAETDLIDRYVRGRLTPDERARFERLYVSHPQRRERVRFAHALATEIDRRNRERRPATVGAALVRWRLPLAAAAAVVFAVAAGLFWGRAATLRRELAAAESARMSTAQQLQQALADERARNDALRTEVDRLTAAAAAESAGTGPASTPLIVSLLLRAGSERGPQAAPPTTLSIPASAREVRLQLTADASSEYSIFDLSVRRAGDGDVFAAPHAQPQRTASGAVFTARVPADRLATGDYILTLRGRTAAGDVDDISRTLFHVERQTAAGAR